LTVDGAKTRPAAFALVGPTASGKSAVALLAAQSLPGEIVSVDSMQVYQGLDIGTAKPSPGDRARLAHHLIDVMPLDRSFDAAAFVQLASAAIDQIFARGKWAILCGGTGLYLKALIDGLGHGPAPDPALRAELEALPLAELLAELREHDPAAYDTVDRKNRRRVIRALEVVRLTGRPLAEQRASWGRPSVAADPAAGLTFPVFGLRRRPDDLARRIDARVDEMFARGLVAETRRLLNRGLAQNRTALQAIGYRQVNEHLQGRRDLEETVALIKQRTRQFAKRQMSWFRHQLAVRWLDVAAEEDAGAIAQRLLARVRVRGS
jgi:tRNA dimethylallyltransferase